MEILSKSATKCESRQFARTIRLVSKYHKIKHENSEKYKTENK